MHACSYTTNLRSHTHSHWFPGITIPSNRLLFHPWKQCVCKSVHFARKMELNQWNLWIWHVFHIYFLDNFATFWIFMPLLLCTLWPYGQSNDPYLYSNMRTRKKVFYFRFIVLPVVNGCVKYTIDAKKSSEKWESKLNVAFCMSTRWNFPMNKKLHAMRSRHAKKPPLLKSSVQMQMQIVASMQVQNVQNGWENILKCHT